MHKLIQYVVLGIIIVMFGLIIYKLGFGQVAIYSQDGKYLGNLNSNQYDPNSVSNPYGRYGNPYSPDSINNKYGVYGNPYSNQSIRNPYAPPYNPPGSRE